MSYGITVQEVNVGDKVGLDLWNYPDFDSG